MALYKTQTDIPLEIEPLSAHALVSWRSIIAGFLVALFTMMGLIGLGLAFGGINMDAETSAKSAGLFSGIWFLVSTLISLFAGSYFAARVSKFRTGRIGSAQGLVIASLFLGFFLYQTVVMIGSVGHAAGSLLGTTGNIVAGTERASGSSAIMNTISGMAERAMGDLNLRSDPAVVAEGVGTRLLRGDTDGAKIYLARQSDLTPAQVNERIANIKLQVDKTVTNAKEATANAMRSTGWTLFGLVVLGAISAVGGGAAGSVANYRKPLLRETDIPYGRHA